MKGLLLSFSILLISILSSCYVTHPRYSTIDEVMQLELGMHLDSANVILQTGPYDLVDITDTSTTYRYKYRLTNVRRVPHAQKRNSGMETDGRFRDLYLSVNTDNELIAIKTNEEPVNTEVEKKKVDVLAIVNVVSDFIVVTLPTLLVYLSIN